MVSGVPVFLQVLHLELLSHQARPSHFPNFLIGVYATSVGIILAGNHIVNRGLFHQFK
jgi:hypothetical protein